MNQHYTRQMMLPEFGETGQAKITATSVLVVGAGGLGCPALSYLAGAGIGRVIIVDHDKIEISNLHRQVLYEMDHVVAVTPQALRIDVAVIDQIENKAGRIVLCCRSGLRAWRGARKLQELGFRNLALVALGG